jgi:uncharacterized alpha-E superfamily protein
MMLLARVADRVYWAARYTERAEDTARIVRAHGELLADLPVHAATSWEPLVAIMGSGAGYDAAIAEIAGDIHGPSSRVPGAEETAVVRFLVTSRDNPSSVASCVAGARENLRTARDTLPAEAWNVLNDLYLYVAGEADRSLERRVRVRFLGRVIGESRRLDGVLATAMTHDEAYAMWRLGRAIERADMTTRVLGVRAAAVLSLPANGQRQGQGQGQGQHQGNGQQATQVQYQSQGQFQQQAGLRQWHVGAPERGESEWTSADLHDEVQWMGVLRSLSGLQMYQRAARGPIEGPTVVRFLLDHDRFPRAVRALLREIRRALGELPEPGGPLDAVDHVQAVLRDSTAAAADGEQLDDAMDALQLAIAQLDRRITDRYLRSGS